MASSHHGSGELIDRVSRDVCDQPGVSAGGECSEELADVGLDSRAVGAESEGVEAELNSIDVSTPRSVQK